MPRVTQTFEGVGFAEAPTQAVADRATASAVEQVGKLAVGALTEKAKQITMERTEKAVSDVARASTAVEEAQLQGATFDESFNPVPTSPDQPLTLDDGIRQEIEALRTEGSQSFRRIAAAAAQGAMPQDTAALAVEAEVRRLVGKTPGFASEIRSLARDLTGFDPYGVGLRRLYQTESRAAQKDTRSSLEKKADSIVEGFKASGVTVSKGDIMGELADGELMSVRAERADSGLKLGDVSFGEWLGERSIAAAPNLLQLGAALIAQTKQDGGVNADQIQVFLNTQKQQAITDLQLDAKRTGHTLRPENLDAINERVNSQYLPIEELTQSTDMTKLMEGDLGRAAAFQRILGAKAMPQLSFLMNVGGPSFAASTLDMFKNVKSPFIRDQIINTNPLLKEAIRASELVPSQVPEQLYSTFATVLQGKAPTPSQEITMPSVEKMVLEQRDSDVRSSYIKGLYDAGRPERGLDMLLSKETIRRMSDDESSLARREYRRSPVVTDQIAENLIAEPNRALVYQNGQFILADKSVTFVRDGKQQFAAIQDDNTRYLNQLVRGIKNGYGTVLGTNEEEFVTKVLRQFDQREAELVAQQQKKDEGEEDLSTGRIIRFENDPVTGALTEVPVNGN